MSDYHEQQRRVEAAMRLSIIRQDDEGARRLVDDLPPEEIARSTTAIRARLGAAAPKDWWTKPATEWGRVETNLFAAQYDISRRVKPVLALPAGAP